MFATASAQSAQAWLAFEEVYHDVDCAGLELLVFELKFHRLL